jgi:UDP-N-acetylmuramoyl-L-alanyl-D-glutamate--2,6-diaminopimelate ligase
MKLLQDILYKTRIEEVIGLTNIAVSSIAFDSRKVEKFGVFVAVNGVSVDGHKYINQTIEAGATAIVCEYLPAEKVAGVTYVRVKNSAEALGIMASNFYDNPSSKLKMIGVTGTNGKTTTVTLLYNLFKALGYKVGMLSTVRNMVDNVEIPSTHTTPDALQLNYLLNSMVTAGCEYCFMEVSSHSIVQKRISGLEFSGGLFTNITHDHLDYHKTFKEYLTAKKEFFDGLGTNAFALTNIDDKNGMVMLQNCKATKQTYALKSPADFKTRIIESHLGGQMLHIENQEVWTKLIGKFNAYNILAVYGVAVNMDIDKLDILTAISQLESVDGRFEYLVTDNNITAVVDYAHTPDALKNVLETIKEIRTGNEQLITVVGCGGDRDREKRPEMARIACEKSDRVIITSDNPRSEEPQAIIDEMKTGVDAINFKKVLTIVDRHEAIRTACALATTGDIILVAGKGHENYQEIKGVKHHFNDKEELQNALN